MNLDFNVAVSNRGSDASPTFQHDACSGSVEDTHSNFVVVETRSSCSVVNIVGVDILVNMLAVWRQVFMV